MKRLLFDIVLRDNFSRNMKKIAGGADSSINKLNKSLAKTKPLSRNIDMLENKLRELHAAQKQAFSVKDIKKYSREIKKTSRELAKLERKGNVKSGSLGGGLGKAGIVGIGLGALYGGVRLGNEIVETTAKYQRFEAVLKNSYGSGLKAKKVMSDLTNFASKTPFQIDELTDSFIKLKNAGLEPSMEEMTNLGDLASSQGKSFGQLSEALLDAQMGEFERLKEFGIKAKTGKNSYSFTFKGQTKEVAKNSKAVKEYILSLGKLKGVQGGMNAISKTTGGQLSNLADNWDQLKAVMGDANRGVIKDAVGGFSSLVAAVKDYMTVPLSQKMREEQYGVKSLVEVITSQNTSNEDRIRLLGKLQEEYPDFLGNLDAETVSNEELLKRLKEVNASYEKRIKLQSALEIQDYNQKKLTNAQNEKDRARIILDLLKKAKSGDKGAEEMLGNYITTSDIIDRYATTSNLIYGITGGWANIRVEDKQSFYDKMIKEQEDIIKNTKERLKRNDVAVASADLQAYLDKSPNLDKLSGKDKARYERLRKTLEYDKQRLTELEKNKANSDSSLFQRTLKEVNFIKSELNKMFGGPEETKSLLSPSGSGTSFPRLLKDDTADITGDTRVAKNLTINIDNMVESLNIVTNTLKEGTAEMKQKVLEALLDAINDVNGA